MTTSIEQYTLINGHTDRVALKLAFESMSAALKVKASLGRTLFRGTGPRVWVDAKPLHHSFDDQYGGGWYESPSLMYGLYIETAEVDNTVVAQYLKDYGFKAEPFGATDVKIEPTIYATQRSRLEEWAKAVDLRVKITETRMAIQDTARFLVTCWDIAVCWTLEKDGNEVGATVERLSELQHTLWYLEQEAERTYFTVYTEGFNYSDEAYANAKYDTYRLATMTAEEVLAL
jgi:hypothetical protein